MEIVYEDIGSSQRGATRLETDPSTELKGLLGGLESVVLDGRPGVMSLVRAAFSATNGEDRGKWTRRVFAFGERAMNDVKKIPADFAQQPYAGDVIVKLQANASHTQICLGSALAAGMKQVDCKDVEGSGRTRCELLVSGLCPSDAIFQPELEEGDVLVIDSGVLRRDIGIDFDNDRVRVDVYAQVFYGWWWKDTVWGRNSMELSFLEKRRVEAVAASEPKKESCTPSADDNNSCAATADITEPELLDMEYDPVSRLNLVFSNRDVDCHSPALFFGNSQNLGILADGRSIKIKYFPGVYSFRCSGVVRKVWMIDPLSETSTFEFFVSLDNFDF